ncbi:MAG TPA: hypothetical protein VNS63_14930 [Blastocatellia bacterium]|nr:hypothetical protein [Blastocatellia bacterium]
MRTELSKLLWEVARLGDGGGVTYHLAASLSPEEKAVFEIGLIDTLTRGTADQQRRVRRALLNCGYDEQCARRVMTESVTDRVRASTLLLLLHPQPGSNANEQSRAAARSK